MSNPIPIAQTMGHTTMQMQKQNMELVQNEVKALGKSGLSPEEKAKKLREQCEGFESIFIQKMWQQMRATLPQENPLVGREEKFWQSMYDSELSKHMSKGGGIGLADMMYEQLSQNLASASRSTATQASTSGGIALEKPLHFAGASSAASPPRTATPTGALQSSDDSGITPEQFMPSPLANMLADKKSTPQVTPRDLLADTESKANVTSAAAGTSVAGNKAPLYEEIGGVAQPATQQEAQSKSALQQTQAYAAQANVAGQNVTMTQQYLQSLHAKQVAQGQTPVAGQLTGPQRAAQAQFFVNSPPPPHGVMPATGIKQEPHVVRTTYTTNVPKGQRTADTQKLVQEALRVARQNQQSTQSQGQGVAQQPVQVYPPLATPSAPTMTGAPLQVAQPVAPTAPVAPTQPSQVNPAGQAVQPQQPNQSGQLVTPAQVNAQMGAHFVAPPVTPSAQMPTARVERTQRKS